MKQNNQEIPEQETVPVSQPEQTEAFTLEDILKEFGGGSGEGEPEADLSEADLSEADLSEADLSEADLSEVDLSEERPAENAGESESPDPMVTTIRMAPVTQEKPKPTTGDTIRLDEVQRAAEERNAEEPAPEETQTPPEEQPEQDAFPENWEPVYEKPMGDYVPPEPIIFRPRSRLRELKKQLVAGPEKRYYELSEMGIGGLQLAIFCNLLIVLLAVGSTVMYGLGMVPESRMKFLIFFQVLVMLVAGLLGSYRLIDGGADLLKGKFTLNSMLMLTFLACCADGVFCLLEQKVPCCAAFSLEMLMCQWSTYHKRVAELGQMDTLRKATRLDGIVREPDYYEGRAGILRRECDLGDFMEANAQTPTPERILSVYAFIAFLISVVVGVIACLLHGMVLGVRAMACAMLASVPAACFIVISRPLALVERRLHKVGTVICGWRGVRELSKSVVFPLGDRDLFPAGAAKMNGVKFFSDRDPDQVVAYATALISADGSGLAPLFVQLLESRNGHHYDAQNLQYYGNGGIGGEVCGEPVLMGVLPFMQEMGVEMSEGTRVNQAMYVAIDGVLCGVFAITYGKINTAAAGLSTLCSYRKLTPVLVSGDFMLTESFLRSKFGVNTRRMAFPPRAERPALASREPDIRTPVQAMTTREGLASFAYAVTGSRALRTAWNVGMVTMLIGGILGAVMMVVLAILGVENLLHPMNLMLYQLIWLIPGVLITEWTRNV